MQKLILPLLVLGLATPASQLHDQVVFSFDSQQHADNAISSLHSEPASEHVSGDTGPRYLIRISDDTPLIQVTEEEKWRYKYMKIKFFDETDYQFTSDAPKAPLVPSLPKKLTMSETVNKVLDFVSPVSMPMVLQVIYRQC